MDILGILFDQKKSTNRFVSDILSFDFHVVDSVTHEFKSDITSNPVEDGVDVTDNIRIMPYKVSMSGMVSNNHIETSILTQAENLLGGVQIGKTPNDYFDILLMIFESKKEITVYTKEKVYTEMAIEAITVPRDRSTGDSLRFSIDFVQIRKVSTQSVKVPDGISRKLDKKATAALQKKADPTKNAGAKPTVDATKNTTLGKNILKNGLDLLKSGASGAGNFIGGL